ncbi:DNA-binding GntR family transcriptional regulator [Sporosarcina luteola]|nr:DNA-binding GntR family transcriptional regulator [Sporosarcina luteola]
MNDNHSTPQYNDLIGDILKRHTEDGGMENLKGQGNPLPKEYFSGDTFQHFQKIAKDAGYKPHWLKLQHEIRDELNDMSLELQQDSAIDFKERIQKVNEKIAEHNKHCPPPFVKGTVNMQSIETAKKFWN